MSDHPGVTEEHYAPPTSPPPPTSAAPPSSGGPTASPTTQPIRPTTQTQPPHLSGPTAELHAMFPSVDPAVIALVLESVDGSSDRAVEQLLGMTDEGYVPDEQGGGRGLSGMGEEETNQLNLDYQMAHTLHLQDQEALARLQRRPGSAPRQSPSQGGQGFGGGGGGVPYQPRVRGSRTYGDSPSHSPSPYGDGEHERLQSMGDEYYGPRQGQGQGQDSPFGALQLEDKLDRATQLGKQGLEVGKQTLGALWGKAREAYTDFQQQRAEGVGKQDRPRESSWGLGAGGAGAGGGGGGGGMRGGYGGQAYGGQGERWRLPGGGRGGRQGGGLWDEEDTPSKPGRSNSAISASSSSSFFSEDTVSSGPTALDPTSASTPPVRGGGGKWRPTDAYDDPGPVPGFPRAGYEAGGEGLEEFGTPAGQGVAAVRKGPAASSATASTASPVDVPGATTSKGTVKIDPAKLGILPKKRVDLLSTSPSPPSTNPTLHLGRSPGSSGSSLGTHTQTHTPTSQQGAGLSRSFSPPSHTPQAPRKPGAAAASGYGLGAANEEEEGDDPNPSLPSASSELVKKIPPTPPAGQGNGRQAWLDDEDELEYTPNPFDEHR